MAAASRSCRLAGGSTSARSASRSPSASRPRKTRLLTVPTGIPRISAACACPNPYKSHRTRATRKSSGTARIAACTVRVVATTAAGSGLVGGGIDGDPVEPGREGGLAAEGAGSAERADEGLLGGVLGVLAVAQDPEAEPVDAALVPGHQLTEGRPVAFEMGGQQFLVAGAVHDLSVASAMPSW